MPKARLVSGIAQLRTRFKNLMDNPLFSVYQRRTNPYTGEALAAGAYGLDRWKAGSSGCTFTRPGTTLTISVGTLVQPVEGQGGPYSVGDNWGQVTLSWAGTAPARINAGAYGPSPMTVTIGNNSKIMVEVGIGTFSEPQLEFGPRPTTFEARTFAEEVNVCQRFFELIVQSQAFVATGAGQFLRQTSTLRPKPSVPTVTTASGGTPTNASSASATTSNQFSIEMTLFNTAAGACQIDGRVWWVEAEPA